jgi:gamma-glutamylcyclotransferase (GGCT)/AIG2-like uncharacterized protein YtfP
MTITLYAAYGSNLDHARMRDRCPGATVVGVAHLPGWRLAVNQYATIRRIAEATVPLGLWRVTPVHIGKLDVFEGVAMGSYERIRIRLPDGEAAWTYVERANRPGPPSAKYVGHLRKGYRDFGLDASPLEAALAESGFA